MPAEDPLELVDDPAAEPTESVVANFTFSAQVVRVGEVVTFESTSLGPVESLTWTFGDDTGDVGPIVTKSWPVEGTYLVVLIADGAGTSDSTSIEIQVLAEDSRVPPRADFGFSSQTVRVGEEVVLTSTSTGDPTSLDWQFGDGTRASGAVVRKAWTAPGAYPVTLTASNEVGADDTTAVITVVPTFAPPVARIDVATTTVDTGELVVLQDISLNNPQTSTWAFGDGTSATGPQVQHRWTEPGVYEVSLTVENLAGSDTAIVTVTVVAAIEPPTARIAEGPTSVEVGVSRAFTSTTVGAATTLVWDFGDGTTDRGQNVSHSWSTPGTYLVTLTASNSAGSTEATTRVIVIPPPPPPVASFSRSPATIITDTVVAFTDTSSGNPTSWTWDFGDGTSSTASSPTHVFAAAGSYTVVLTASNSGGSSSASVTLTVQPPAPVASFTFAPSAPLTGQPVDFTDASTNQPTSWTWDFGDGTTSTDRNPTHSYATPGPKTVTLTATNITGSHTVTQVIGVSLPPPVASFTVAPPTPTILDTVVFTNTSTGSALSHSWNFGDGSAVVTTADASHIFATAGTYEVALTVTNSGGTSTSQRTVVVALPPPPVPDFSWTAPPILPGQVVAFTNSTTGTVATWQWNFGDGSAVVTTADASHIFATAGTYSVTLTATGPGAGNPPQSITESVVVSFAPPVASFTSSATTIDVGESVTFTDTSTGATSREWRVNGALISTAASVTHTFGINGVHTVLLTVTGPGGTDTAEVTITTLLIPDFVMSNAAPNAGASVTFTDQSVGAVVGWTWDFGDGSPASTLPNPAHTYTASGPFIVTLTANGAGGPQVVSKTINVTLVANFTPSALTAEVGVPIVFTDSSIGTVTSRAWTFGDGGLGSTAVSPSRSWALAGTYTVELTLQGPGGPATHSVVVTVTDPPV